MTATPPSKIHLPPHPSQYDIFTDSALSTDTPSPTASHSHTHPPASPVSYRRRSTRPSFNTLNRSRRVSKAATAVADAVEVEEVKLPSLVPGIRPAYSTPLPMLPMTVLCLAMLSELLAANLCTPFLLRMVERFYHADGREKNSETEAAVGLWTGNLVSVFFITQFLTSLLWSSIADRHGRRAVIVASLAGSAIALVTFGTSESLPEAICVRLVQGIFGGAVGVFRGSIRDLTDDTNATRAYAILGFSWGFGGVVGPILGGVFESPQLNFPGTFLGEIQLFQDLPYLLPTVLGSSILVVGAIMACFLSWDGGVRGGSRIALPVERDEPLVAGSADVSPAPSSRTAVPIPSLANKRSAILSPAGNENGPNALATSFHRRDSRASLGTAYGYGGIRSKHPTLAARAALEAARKASVAPRPGDLELDDDAPEVEDSSRMGLAKKFLLANEENTFNLNDLWVSAAVAQDTAVFEDDDLDAEDDIDEQLIDEDGEDEDADAVSAIASTTASRRGTNNFGSRRVSRARLVSGAPSVLRTAHRLSTSTARRFSTASGVFPSIFGNTGLATPPAMAQAYDVSPSEPSQRDSFFPSPTAERRPPMTNNLSVIAERPSTASDPNEASPLVSPVVETMTLVKPTSSFSQLPFLIISQVRTAKVSISKPQYGLLALHGTVHDQLFLSFLVT